MKRKLEKNIPLVTLPVMLVVCLVLWALTVNTQYTDFNSGDGIWDLRGFNFSSGSARVLGAVEYIPDALLTPEEFEARSGEARLGRPQDNGVQYCTSRMRILVPEGATYAVACRSIDYAERIYMNGKHMADVGMPGDSKESSVPGTGSLYFMDEPVDGVIEIVRQTSNFVHREGGWHDGVRVGYPGIVRASHQSYAEAIIMGCFLALFLVHLALFFVLRAYPANLYFSLFCLTWFLRAGVVDGKVFSALLPGLPWIVEFRIEYLALPVASILMLLMLNELFPDVLPKWLRRGVYIVSAVFICIFLFADSLFMSRAIFVCYAYMTAAIIVITVCFILRLRKPSQLQIVFFTGLAFFFYAGLRDMFYYNNIVLPPFLHADLSKISMLVFVFFQMTAMFMGTVYTAEEARAAEQRVAAENAALERMQQMKSDLLATVSHETRTPLAVLSGYAELISMEMQKKGVDDQTARDLAKISGEAQRLADIMTEMQRISGAKDAATHKAQTNLSEIVQSAARLYTPILARQNTTLKTDVQENLPLVYANANELTQVLFNLLANAKNYTDGGTVIIMVTYTGEAVAVTVSDTGSGIPPDLLPHIFERGVSGDVHGSGLGLAICKEIIEGHGGEIRIEGIEKGGTKATFALPMDAEKKEDAGHGRNHSVG